LWPAAAAALLASPATKRLKEFAWNINILTALAEPRLAWP
jgi:hypothetical protein